METPTRDRLLQSAAELFYAEGIVAAGVDKICQRAQVSKRSLYQLFGTKDELVAASLERFGAQLMAQYVPPEDAELTPAAADPAGLRLARGRDHRPGLRRLPVRQRRHRTQGPRTSRRRGGPRASLIMKRWS